MRYRGEQTYDHTPAGMFTLLTDAGFREEVATETGATRHRVEVVEKDEGTSVLVETHLPTTTFPTVVRKILGEDLVIHQEELWSDESTASLRLTTPGQPGKVTGTMTLAPRDGGSVQLIDADITVRVPLVGGRIEELIGWVLSHVLELQGQVAQGWTVDD